MSKQIKFTSGQISPIDASFLTGKGSLKARTALRMKLLKDYIRSRPSGEPMHNTELARIVRMTPADFTTWSRRELFTKEFARIKTREGFVYSVLEDVKTRRSNVEAEEVQAIEADVRREDVKTTAIQEPPISPVDLIMSLATSCAIEKLALDMSVRELVEYLRAKEV